MIRDRRWLWLLAALPPLLYLPLQAQDSAQVPPQPQPRETTSPTPAAGPTPAATTPAAEAASSDAPDTEERVSADNNLSFPVDI